MAAAATAAVAASAARLWSLQMSSSSTSAGTRRVQYPLLDCPDCHVPLIRIVSKQEHSKDVTFVKCPNNVKGDSTTCAWIRSEDQYEAWFLNQQKQKHMQVQLPVRTGFGHGIGDFKQQLGEMQQTLDSVVQDLRIVKAQIGDNHSVVRSPASDHPPLSTAKQDMGNRKMQIVLDVSVAVAVLVGVLIGIVVAQMMK